MKSWSEKYLHLSINTYFFSSDTKLLVITGEWEIAAGGIFWPNGESAFTEVMDFSEEKLVCDTFTTDYERHSYFGMTGGLIKENIPLICGPLLNGALKQRLGECFIFGQKNKIVKMSYSRAGGSSAIVINDKVSPVRYCFRNKYDPSLIDIIIV